MCENNYDTCLMAGTIFTRTFNLTNEDFKFTDYLIKLEIRDGLFGDTIFVLEDTDFVKTDTTLTFSIGASYTQDFPIKQLNYGISLTDLNDSENVINFMTGTITMYNEIPQIPRIEAE